ncbi:MAG: peptidoglycan-binding domain-containing protein [Candidatus Moraniibacteriota bacterium]
MKHTSLKPSIAALFTVAVFLGLGFGAKASAATLYFHDTSDHNWDTLANWRVNSYDGALASGLPTTGDEVHVVGNSITAGTTASIGVLAVTAGVTISNVDITVSSIAVFSDLSTLDTHITGAVTFTSGSQNRGDITGKATFNDAIGGVMTVPNNGAWGDGTATGGSVGLDDEAITSWVFEGDSVNNGTIDNTPVFNGTSQNAGTIMGSASFNGGSYNSGTVTGKATFNDAIGGVMTVPNNGAWGDGTATGGSVGLDDEAITSWVFEGDSVNNGTIGNHPVFNVASSNTGTINGNVTFNDDSYNESLVDGDATFNDRAANYDHVTGTGTFNDRSHFDNGAIDGNAVFVGPLSNRFGGTVGGAKKRWYVTDTKSTLDFTADGPWTVVADGITVNRHFAHYDGTTTFQTLNGGSFDDTAVAFPGATEHIAGSTGFHGGGTLKAGWNGDDKSWSYDLPFTFRFYGHDYKKVYVSSNGYIGFTEDGDMTRSNFTIQDSNDSPIIAALLTDLVTSDVYVTDNGDGKVIFRWKANEYGNPDLGAAVNFEITLNGDNTFQLDYGDETDPLSGTVEVGVNDGYGTSVISAYDGRDTFNRLQTSSWNEPINDGVSVDKFRKDMEAGFIGIAGSDPANTSKVTFNTEYTITSGDVKIVFPAGTEMTNSDGENLNLTSMTAEDITAAVRGANTVTIAGAVSIGIPNLRLSFSKDISVTIPVDSSLDGQTLDIWYQNAGESAWTKGPSCIVAAGSCTFTTNHATTYSAGDEPSSDTVVTVADTPESAKIASWKAYLQPSDSKCATKLKLNVLGRHFASGVEVKIGGKSASSVKRKSSRELTATFCFDKLIAAKTDFTRRITVTNHDTDPTKATSQIHLDAVFPKFTEADLNPSTSAGIQNIQKALVKLKLLRTESITGTYGPATTAAVRKFQSQNGLTASGSFGIQTQAKLAEKYGKKV